MRRLRIALCALCLTLLVPLLLHARQTLPLDTRPLVAEKYAGWSGVLRLWVFEGWSCGAGSIAPWLNQCVSRFERSRSGVYVQPRFVDADAIASLNESGILPPDLILFPPGLLETPEGLMSTALSDGVRPALRNCGLWNGACYATPVAMGGYLWAWNAELTDGIPGTWRDEAATLAAPPPEAWRRWDAALLALCSGRYSASDSRRSTERDDPAPQPLDLGLAAGDASTPIPTPTVPAPDALPCRLPSGFQYDETAWRRFSNGEVAAIPVTQQEIRRLQALSDRGKGPDWRLSRGGASFSDMLLCLAIVDKPDDDPRRALCEAFLSTLLTDECQGALSLAEAFSVTDSPSGYSAGDPLAALDAALRDPGTRVPPAFGSQWVSAAEGIVREFLADAEESPVLWRQLGDVLCKNPND